MNVSSEFQLLIDAVKSLKPEDDFVKDYIFPVATAFFSSLLGGAVAYITFKHQDAILFEKEKLNTTNKWTIIALDALHALQSIKQNYFETLSEDPYQRALAVPAILGQFSKITEPLSTLSFISPKAKNGKPEFSKWSQIPLIQTLFYNYNYLLGVWEKRNELDRAVKVKLLQACSTQAYGVVNKELMRKFCDPVDLANLIELTERAVRLTDDLIVELDDFLCNFSSLTESRIKLNKLKNYGSLLKYSHTRESKRYLGRSVAANYELISDLLGMTSEELEERYKTGYEVVI